MEVQNDAFSSGQVGSKLWLCQVLERVLAAHGRTQPQTVWIYGGWQGVLGFMMLSREGGEGSIHLESVRSFDRDDGCADVANQICENWVWREWKFRAFTADCNEIDPADGSLFGPCPTIVVNTSVEHFESRIWFEKIPAGTVVAMQAADFDHDGAVAPYGSMTSFAEAFPLAETMFEGSIEFDYKTWKFNRLMRIGVR